ncbi:Protein singed [Eumeta japonica]|uniref:Protein singed n=1 Tax=Eumeta variegata TaxID=151549 RepID=A0A4C1UXR6_EUMVA|nr:Protein singed [Eumeta japonica]
MRKCATTHVKDYLFFIHHNETYEFHNRRVLKVGVDLTANQDEISAHETFQLEFDWATRRWYVRTMQDRYWTLETGGGIQASADKKSVHLPALRF